LKAYAGKRKGIAPPSRQEDAKGKA